MSKQVRAGPTRFEVVLCENYNRLENMCKFNMFKTNRF